MYALRTVAATAGLILLLAAPARSAAPNPQRVPNRLPTGSSLAPFVPRGTETIKANSASFTDPAGDNGTALDIATVGVSSDDAGQMTIKVDTPSAVTLPTDAIFLVALDTDQSPLTGDLDALGAEYVLVVDGSDNSYGLLRWNGASFDFVPTPTAAVAYSSGLSATVSLTDLGSPAVGVNLWVRASQGPDAGLAGHYDDAPDSGTYSFKFVPAAPPTVKGILYQTTPLVPQAGKRFKLIVAGLRVDPPESTGPITTVPQPDTVACTGKLNGKRLAGLSANGCMWLLPKNARRKLFTVSVKIGYKGVTATFPLVAQKVR